MKSLKKFTLPLIMASCMLGFAGQAAMAEPTIIPAFQIAADPGLDPNGMELRKSDLGNGDDNHSGIVDSKDAPGVQALGDNTNDMADANDSDTQTFNTTLWVLLAIVAVGAVAFAMTVFRRQSTSH